MFFVCPPALKPCILILIFILLFSFFSISRPYLCFTSPVTVLVLLDVFNMCDMCYISFVHVY